MKMKLNTNLVVNVVIIGIILLYLSQFILFRTVSTFTTATFTDIVTNNQLKPIDADIPETVSYRTYKHMQDSITTTRALKNGNMIWFGGITTNVIGTTGALACDTCRVSMQDVGSLISKHQQNYIMLTGWQLKMARTQYGTRNADSVQFFVEHGQAYVRKNIQTYYTKLKNGSTRHIMSQKDIPVKFRYDDQANCLLIAVSGQTKQIMSYVAGALALTTILYALYLMAAFLKFTIDVSRGLAFTDKNVWRLKLIAVSLILYPVVILLLNLLIKLIFHNYFTADVALNANIWTNWWKGIAAGIVFLLLFKSFRQGKLLKDEQDLTV